MFRIVRAVAVVLLACVIGAYAAAAALPPDTVEVPWPFTPASADSDVV
ncbi:MULTISPECIES: hypothetical protein [Rhodococcus]|uniref:Uncharacterized protein n=1 Tax=Rhodococcus oxybenzonivorans TaxID=1990687 RepID=A0AAE4V622_9NOCA|nr:MULTISPECIES: hypothetical protein [Rhodococcus]MDV7245395.1 hypothetical protein [Rhodococcus oxybenzonivorans]MDV7268887.1 hypothetical protein [Rhodococcus oxybenzonivorans]MDV7276475.1 hypothetical protein [Rhodococcus oxybenzonivorans]MDV7336598.1 hypothetical protein [Rhodococcus oxybenzonivorans]MDV7346929.1 hypothetical protein [Rhodococcus oxybenzonivorans]